MLDKIKQLDREHFQFGILNPPQHWWWFCMEDGETIGFAGAKDEGAGLLFLGPAGVLEPHRGRGVHGRLIRSRICHARQLGFVACVSYTKSDNYISANNLIKEGFRLAEPWNDSHNNVGICLRKDITTYSNGG